MPIMNAKFLDTDPAGADLLRSILETGRRGRRRKLADLVGLRAQRAAEPVRPLAVETAETDGKVHPAVLATAAE